jgi:LPXTG-motif cell wall-anchored protein
MRFPQRTCAALAAGIAAALLPLSAAQAAVTTHNSADVGLFGASDPSFDGAFRQSLGLLAEHAGGVHDSAAISWLLRQQCPDGGWTAYRSDLSKPCPATDLKNFVGEDSNSTALAVEALHAVGATPKYDAVAFLHTLQDSDGGFPLLAGSGTDPNSTALVVQAIRAADQDPTSSAWTKGAKTPIDALMTSWLGCGSSDPGAFSSPYSSGHGDLVASVQAVWGVEQQTFPFTATPTATQPAPDCTAGPVTPTPAQAGQYAATWLAGKLTGAGFLSTGSSPDDSLTAQGVLAMQASGTNSAAVTKALDYLAANAHAAILDTHGNVSPGSIGYIALAAHAAGRSLTSFGGVDLLSELAASRRALPVTPVTKPVTKPVTQPVSQPVHQPSTQHATGGQSAGSGATLPNTGVPANVAAGVGVDCLLVGVLLMVAGRRRRTTHG